MKFEDLLPLVRRRHRADAHVPAVVPAPGREDLPVRGLPRDLDAEAVRDLGGDVDVEALVLARLRVQLRLGRVRGVGRHADLARWCRSARAGRPRPCRTWRRRSPPRPRAPSPAGGVSSPQPAATSASTPISTVIRRNPSFMSPPWVDGRAAPIGAPLGRDYRQDRPRGQRNQPRRRPAAVRGQPPGAGGSPHARPERLAVPAIRRLRTRTSPPSPRNRVRSSSAAGEHAPGVAVARPRGARSTAGRRRRPRPRTVPAEPRSRPGGRGRSAATRSRSTGRRRRTRRPCDTATPEDASSSPSSVFILEVPTTDGGSGDRGQHRCRDVARPRSRRGPGSRRPRMRAATASAVAARPVATIPAITTSGSPAASTELRGRREQRPARDVVVAGEAERRAVGRASAPPTAGSPPPAPVRHEREPEPAPLARRPPGPRQRHDGHASAASSSIAPCGRRGPRGDDRGDDAAVLPQALERGHHLVAARGRRSPARSRRRRPRAPRAPSPARAGDVTSSASDGDPSKRNAMVGRVVGRRARRRSVHATVTSDAGVRATPARTPRAATLEPPGRDGGTGRRAGLKNPWASAREGSIPSPGTVPTRRPCRPRRSRRRRPRPRGRRPGPRTPSPRS